MVCCFNLKSKWTIYWELDQAVNSFHLWRAQNVSNNWDTKVFTNVRIFLQPIQTSGIEKQSFFHASSSLVGTLLSLEFRLSGQYAEVITKTFFPNITGVYILQNTMARWGGWCFGGKNEAVRKKKKRKRGRVIFFVNIWHTFVDNSIST